MDSKAAGFRVPQYGRWRSDCRCCLLGRLSRQLDVDSTVRGSQGKIYDGYEQSGKQMKMKLMLKMMKWATVVVDQSQALENSQARHRGSRDERQELH
jgi:hypothetical protein